MKNTYKNNAIAFIGLIFIIPTLASAQCGSACTNTHTTYKMVRQASCGASVAIANVRVPKPTCTLVPALTSTGAIELQWTTNGASVAFIDSGIGHVSVRRGSRIVTPSVDTAYNLTVLNDAGIAGSCGARVNVSLASATELSVLSVRNVRNYALNEHQVAGAVEASNNVETDTNTVEQVNTSGDVANTDASELSDDADTATSSGRSSGLFGSTFKKVAIPIGIVFLLLIIILVVMMGKIKEAK